VKVFYCDQFVLPLPADHRFPMRKYTLLRERLIETAVLKPDELLVPEAATDVQIRLAHTAAYWEKVKHGALSPKEIRRMGFPWSPQLVERSRRSVGGTIAACRAALEDGIAVNLAGGTHHAFPDFGAGFCVLNDVAIAARVVGEEKQASIVVVDCDVHQGDGTAAILAGDDGVFTFSIHGARNFPFRKQRSNLDIALEDGAGDEVYLTALQDGLETALAQAQANLAIYVAGADPFEGDRLGRLAVSQAGLAQRDRLVFDACRTREIAVAVVMGGGYARDIDEIVEIHWQTVRTAAQFATYTANC
jgi:acetoin utilization deacetylase AcuC-like enzyme